SGTKPPRRAHGRGDRERGGWRDDGRGAGRRRMINVGSPGKRALPGQHAQAVRQEPHLVGSLAEPVAEERLALLAAGKADGRRTRERDLPPCLGCPVEQVAASAPNVLDARRRTVRNDASARTPVPADELIGESDVTTGDEAQIGTECVGNVEVPGAGPQVPAFVRGFDRCRTAGRAMVNRTVVRLTAGKQGLDRDRKSTRLNSSHVKI